jgi:hypothetical protein
MPEISRFFGIVIRMFVEAGESHRTPHFHAYYQDRVAIYDIERIERLAGSLCVAALILAMVVCASRSEAASDNPPETLVSLGQRVGCRVLRKPPVTPLGVFTVWIAERQTGTAYAAWCVRESHEVIVYDLLVSATARQHPWAQCRPHIRLGMDVPFPQLRATMLPRDLPYPKTLADFWYPGKDWLQDGELVGGSEIPSGPALDIGLGSAGQILMCLRGRWIMGGYH